jgi:hypothetical protein
MMRKRVLRNVTTARRCHRLGDIGEKLAEQLLEANGFTNIQSLNKPKKNHVFADVYAERDRQVYVISVKIRNKYEFGTRKLNSRYKLGQECYEHAREAEARFQAVAAWLTISLEETTFSAYFGLLKSLGGSTGISMTEQMVTNYECLARDQEHGYAYDGIRNAYRMKEAE